MLKILLVDDEIQVVEGMKVSVEWEKHGFCVAGEAYNGQEGLEKALELKPDVVITDITMPEMDGIEMAEKIREILPLVKLLFLTCHEDFNYARHAIKLSAEEYLIKMTMTKEDLYAVLDRLRIDINKEREHKREDIHIAKELNQNRYLMGELLINEIINGNGIHKLENLKKRLEIYEYKFTMDKFLMGLLRIDNYLEFVQKSEFNDSELIKFIVLNVTEEIIGKYDLGKVFSKSENEFIIIFNFNQDSSKSIEGKLKSVCMEVQASLKSVLGNSCTIYLGKQFASLTDARHAYHQIRKLDYLRFYAADQTLISLNDFHGDPINMDKDCCKIRQLLNDFSNALGDFDNERMERIIHYLMEYFLINRIQVNEVKNIACKIIHSLFDCMNTYGIDSTELLFKPYKEILVSIDSIKNLENMLCQCSKKAVELISKAAAQSSTYTIDRILRYVNENYYEGLTLDSVASHFNMNSSYFSRFFKSKTGENFVEYLAKLRVDKSKELLIKTQLNIDSIAEQVGHVNAAYFSKVFKKFTGTTPGKYRNVMTKKRRFNLY